MDAYSSGEEVVVKTRKPYTITKQRERWTEEEHTRFLDALKLYGRAWQRIEEHIGTKTAVQIRSHAQKFFTKLEKEALVKGVPIGQALDIEIPPPRPKRKPSNPYPRKTSVGAATSHSGAKDGKPLMSISSSRCKQALDLEKEPLQEKPNGDEGPTTGKENKDENCSTVFTVLKEAPCSSISSANQNSMSMFAPLRNSCTFREFIPSVKEAITHDETNESLITNELKENQKIDDGKQMEQNDSASKATMLENTDASCTKFVQGEKTNDLTCELTIDGMQSNQKYPRHVAVHVIDGNIGTTIQNGSHNVLIRDSIFHPIGGVNEQPNLFTNSAASNTSESQSNNARSSVHQPFPAYPPFTPVHHNQEDYQSFLHMSSTFSSLVVSTLLQHPAAHTAASFAATFWPYANAESSADSPACPQGIFPPRQIGSPPSMAAIAAATVAAATAWWAAHGLLPLCAPLHTAFACPPASTAVQAMDTGEEPAAKTEKGETTAQNPTLQDQMLDPEHSEALQAQNSASKSPAISSDSEESGNGKLNTSAKAMTDHDKDKAISKHPDSNKAKSRKQGDQDKAISEHLDSNKAKGRKQVDRSSCGSNTTSSSELETDILEKDKKEKEESAAADPTYLAAEISNRRSRSTGNITDSWKEVSEEGRLAFQALFTREVLPQSFSPAHDLTNSDQQMDAENNKQGADDKDDLHGKKSSSDQEGVEKNLLLVENNNEEAGLLTIGLGQGKLKARRTGFKPYKRCSVEANDNRSTTASTQGEEKCPKRIRLEGGAST